MFLSLLTMSRQACKSRHASAKISFFTEASVVHRSQTSKSHWVLSPRALAPEMLLITNGENPITSASALQSTGNAGEMTSRRSDSCLSVSYDNVDRIFALSKSRELPGSAISAYACGLLQMAIRKRFRSYYKFTWSLTWNWKLILYTKKGNMKPIAV